jgi:hypothetical protein
MLYLGGPTGSQQQCQVHSEPSASFQCVFVTSLYAVFAPFVVDAAPGQHSPTAELVRALPLLPHTDPTHAGS